MKEFAVNLKKVRESVGLTQEELAKELGVSIYTYRNWEAFGKGHCMPKPEMVIKLTEVLNVGTNELYGR